VQPFGDLHSIGADVLHRRRSDRAGDQRQVFQAADTLVKQRLHGPVPVDAGADFVKHDSAVSPTACRPPISMRITTSVEV